MRSVTAGATNVSTYVMLVDSASGAPETGYTIANLDLSYVRELLAPSTKVDAVALDPAAPTTAHTDNRAIEIDATDMEGLYRVDWPDLAFAAGVSQVTLYVKGVGLAPAVETVMIGAPVDVTAISGDTTAADNAELDYDGTGYAKANSTIGTCTTLTGHTAQTANHTANIALILGDSGELQTDWANGGRLDLLLDSVISKVDVVDGIVDNVLLDTAEIGTAGAGLTAVATQVWTASVHPGSTGTGLKLYDISVDTAEIGTAGAGLTEAGGTGDHLTAVAWNSAWDAEVQSECTDALNAYDPPTKAEIDSAHSTTDALITTVDGIVDDILLDTAVIGSAGAGLTAVPWNSAWDAEVQSECTDALTAYDPPTKAEIDSAHSTTDALITTVDGIVDNILLDTGELQTDLTNGGRLDLLVDSIISKVDVVDGIVDNILIDTAEIGTAGAGLTEAGGTGDHLGDLGGMSTGMKAEVNAEALDVINTDTLTLPGQAAPSNTPTLREAIGWLYKTMRNKKTQTATQWNLYDDAGTTIDAKATVADDGTTASKTEIGSGP